MFPVWPKSRLKQPNKAEFWTGVLCKALWFDCLNKLNSFGLFDLTEPNGQQSSFKRKWFQLCSCPRRFIAISYMNVIISSFFFFLVNINIIIYLNVECHFSTSNMLKFFSGNALIRLLDWRLWARREYGGTPCSSCCCYCKIWIPTKIKKT